MSTSTNKDRVFVTSDGKNVMFTFILVSSLFLLWGFGNGMIDVMDKHFQEELHLSLAQSANVQWAHYLGYFLMSMPAGWLASRLGYKGGIIAGLLMVAMGGLWFIPATQIAQFWAFLVGVCLIASGFTFLETIANPYTTVLGDPRYAASRINLAQSANGIGWILGPIVGGLFFYSKDAAGQSTGSQMLWIPYAAIAIVVAVLSIVFYFAEVPDIKAEDDYHLDDDKTTSSRSIWTHPHFVFAVVAQFFYVAAQAGIFSFLINYMTAEPVIPASWYTETTKKWDWIEINTTFSKDDIKNLPDFAQRLKQKSDPVSIFIYSQLSEPTIEALAEYKGDSDSKLLRSTLSEDLKKIVSQDPGKVKSDEILCVPARFNGISLSEKTQKLMAQKADEDAKVAAAKKAAAENQSGATTDLKTVEQSERVNLRYLNRSLLHDAYPDSLPFDDAIHCISNNGASLLASFGFVCFLIGRFSGAGLMKKFSANKILGLYGVLNVIACLLVFLKLGWLSVACVFLSYFFMSIMFPTIFALGIFGLGARAKKASAYIVMAIMGGAILPKLMGSIADHYDMSRSFIVPMVCFIVVALYGFTWPMLSKTKSMNDMKISGGH
jgi:fucose permease